jgi:uncharacterized surface protein with fasciclin (FAS1) repeats
MVDYLDKPNSNLTMFMPVNNAWAEFLVEVGSSIETLQNSSQVLEDILLYHVHGGALSSYALQPPMVRKT